MTSTYSTNKAIEEPANGDYVNTWSTPVNSNFNIIDKAFGGHLIINATGVSGTTALTTTQYQNLYILFSGTLSANVNYQVPSGVGGQWVVYNGTSGAFTLTLSSGGGGSSVTITQGTRTLIVSDGTNVTLSVNTVTSPGGADTSIQFNQSGVFGGSSNLAWNYGTNTLTVTGAVNVNGTINAYYTGKSGLLINEDSSSNVFINQQDNGPLILNTNNTERMRITAAGNVGIGTSAPSALLTVNGSFSASGVSSFANATTNFGAVSAASGPNLYLINTNGGAGAGASLVFLNNNSSAAQKTAAYINGGLVVSTAGAEQGLIDFEVFDGTNNANRIIGMQVNTGGTSATFAPNTDNYWNLGLSGYRWSNLYAVNANFTTGYFSNNVGIGNSAPAYRLQVNTTTNGNDGISVTNNSTGPFAQAFINVNAAGWTGVQLLQNQSLGVVSLYTGDNVPLVFSTNAAERMRISAAGNVGIGTSAPVSPLTVNGPGAATPSLSAAGGAVTISNNNDLDLQIGESSVTGFAGIYLQSKRHSNDGTSWQLYLNPLGGSVGIGTSTPGTGTILDVQSTGAGVRFPNMTTTQKTAITPAAGTVVFDTTLAKLCLYTGAAWQTITSA